MFLRTFLMSSLSLLVSSVPIDFTYTLYSLDTTVNFNLPSTGYLFNDEGLLAHLQTKLAPHPGLDCKRPGGVTTINRFTTLIKVSHILETEVGSLEDVLEDSIHNCSLRPYYVDTDELDDLRFHTYDRVLFYTYDPDQSINDCVLDWTYTGSVLIDELVHIPTSEDPLYTFQDFCTDGHLEFNSIQMNSTTLECWTVDGDHLDFYSQNCDNTANQERLSWLHTISFVRNHLNWVLIAISITGSVSVISLFTWCSCLYAKKNREHNARDSDAYTPLHSQLDADAEDD